MNDISIVAILDSAHNLSHVIPHVVCRVTVRIQGVRATWLLVEYSFIQFFAVYQFVPEHSILIDVETAEESHNIFMRQPYMDIFNSIKVLFFPDLTFDKLNHFRDPYVSCASITARTRVSKRSKPHCVQFSIIQIVKRR